MLIEFVNISNKASYYVYFICKKKEFNKNLGISSHYRMYEKFYVNKFHHKNDLKGISCIVKEQ